MAVNDRRLTGRDVLAKTFQPKTKRGYDPVEVDAYLELVAAQIDMLHSDMSRLPEADAASEVGYADAAEREAGSAEHAMLTAAHDDLTHAHQELTSGYEAAIIERDALRVERDQLGSSHSQLIESQAVLVAENEQLRMQVADVAPPPPGAQGEIVHVVLDDDLVVDSGDDRAVEESYELVLRMARRSAEEAISEAHTRADEIVADANFTAAQISRESDRKAFEAANKVQAELSGLTDEIDAQKAELHHLDGRTTEKRMQMRELANKLILIAEDQPRRLEGAEVVDLRSSSESV